METLSATAKVSEDGTLTLSVPDPFKGATVHVEISKPDPDVPRDARGWPIGFFAKYVGCITDPKFKQHPQPEADPPPLFE
jgi:hypothetical protein